MSQQPSDVPPMRVIPLTSHTAELAGRALSARLMQPGVVRFIAITSIVVASLGILVSGVGAVMDIGLIFSASEAKATARSAGPVPLLNARVLSVTNTSTERLPANGLNYFQRQTFANELQRIRPLSADQLAQLDELLAENGKVITGDQPIPPSDQFSATITRSGHTGMRGSQGSDYFEMARGRLELSDNRAVYFPAGGQPAIHSNVIAIPPPTFGTSAVSLQPDQIRSIVRTVNDLNGSKIKAAQMKTLIQTMQAPGQQIIVRTTDGSDPANQIVSAVTRADGTLQVDCVHGAASTQILCDANGTIVPPPPPVAKEGVIDETAGAAALAATAVELLVAVFLLIVGILTLRRSPQGRRLHWFYVGLKLPIGIAGGALSAWMWITLIQDGATQATNSNPAATVGSMTAGVLMGALPALIGCVWPIALIFLLNRRNVRLYYGPDFSR